MTDRHGIAISLVVGVALWLTIESRSDEPVDADATAADPMRGKEPGQVRQDNGLSMKLVWCSPGFVRMENERIEVVVETEDEAVEDDEIADAKTTKRETRRLRIHKDEPAQVFL